MKMESEKSQIISSPCTGSLPTGEGGGRGLNPELDLAWNIIANTDTHLFLTGKAGTGKTTFLRELRRKVPKRMIVVAPTGIAAINAEGVTIHSFFQLPFGPQIPGTQYGNNKRYAFRRQKLRLIRSVDLVVIDEISMVRADLLDAIDSVLRQYRDKNRAFGGVQMLMIGDMQQLAPVAREDEWAMLRPYYDTPYFFSSKALQQTDFVTVELQHVYRQSDPLFVSLLNKVRTNTVDAETLQTLNQRCIAGFNPPKQEGYIRLVTHNQQADYINQQELDKLNVPAYHYDATIWKDFPELSFPTEKTLTLKLGAQVMFIKNDSSPEKKYYNGMIGEVVDIDDDHIQVRPSGQSNVIDVTPAEWQNMKYELDEKTKEIHETVVGTFTQYPLKTAWAITVHKSQGLTFEHAIIDVQHSFAHGQTYVALSRCKSLEGMVLAAPIPQYAIINDKTVETFQEDPRHKSPDGQKLDQMQRHYLLRTIEDLFSFTQIRFSYGDLIRLMREHFYSSANKQYNAWVESSEAFKKKVEEVAAKFHNQYQNIVLTEVDYQNSELLQERLRKGAEYFEQQLSETFTLLTKTALETNNKMVKERLDNLMQNFNDLVKFKVLLLHYVAHNGLSLQPYLQAKAKISLSLDDNEKEDKGKSKEDRVKSKETKETKPKVTMEMKQEKALVMYLDGKLVEDIAKDMGVVESTVYSYLLPSVLNGKLPLNHLFEQKKIDAVNKCLDANPTATAKEVVEALGREDYGYGIVKCCMAVRGRM